MNDTPPITEFPADRELSKKHAFDAFVLNPIERVTWSINRGDRWDLRDLTAVRNRCKALVDAYDKRMGVLTND